MIKFFKNWVDDKIPESVQFAFVIILVLVAPVILFYFGSHYELINSTILLITGIAIAFSKMKNLILEKTWYAVGFVLIFSFAGAVLDGAGNIFYNKPLEKLCPAETVLIREVEFVEGYNYDDEDRYIQKFSCFSKSENRIIEVISGWKLLGIRFLEYTVLSLIFLGIYWSLSKFQIPKKG